MPRFFAAKNTTSKLPPPVVLEGDEEKDMDQEKRQEKVQTLIQNVETEGIAEHPQQQSSHNLQPKKPWSKRELAQSFYCEICRVTCPDPRSYDAHLNGQRHQKKKVSQSQSAQVKLDQWLKSPTAVNSAATQLFCKLCDIACDSEDAFVAHVRGVKHLRGPHLSTDDQYVISKHMDLYPPEDEMREIDHAILVFEHALKLAFYVIAAKDALAKKMDPLETPGATAEAENAAGKMATDELCQDSQKEITEMTATEAADCKAAHLLTGAMRVGSLSKCVLLRGDHVSEHLVVVCCEKPTRSLLQRIVDQLSAALEFISPLRKFNVETHFEKSGLFVTIEKPAASFVVTLTSMLFDEDQVLAEQVDPAPPSVPSDQLSPGNCLSALALVRQTVWFQENLSEMKAGTVVTHVLRDLCRRNSIWTPLSEWAQELLVERCISMAGINIGPGEALRQFFECIALGILLPGGPGVMDPCEKVPTDVTACLTSQQCEEITASAQQFLGMLVCHQMQKILDVAQVRPSALKRRVDVDDEPEKDEDKKQKLDDPAVEGNSAKSEDPPVLASD